jgi:hypothetical protein
MKSRPSEFTPPMLAARTPDAVPNHPGSTNVQRAANVPPSHCVPCIPPHGASVGWAPHHFWDFAPHQPINPIGGRVIYFCFFAPHLSSCLCFCHLSLRLRPLVISVFAPHLSLSFVFVFFSSSLSCLVAGVVLSCLLFVSSYGFTSPLTITQTLATSF